MRNIGSNMGPYIIIYMALYLIKAFPHFLPQKNQQDGTTDSRLNTLHVQKINISNNKIHSVTSRPNPLHPIHAPGPLIY